MLQITEQGKLEQSKPTDFSLMNFQIGIVQRKSFTFSRPAQSEYALPRLRSMLHLCEQTNERCASGITQCVFIYFE